MSDTTSFLGGAAIAGLAVLVLSRGGANPSPLAPQPLPAPSTIASPVPSLIVPSPDAYHGSQQSEVQKLQAEQLKAILEQQRSETEKLKDQIQKQQEAIQILTIQLKDSGSSSQLRALQPVAAPAEQTPNPVLMGLLWAAGGIILSLGGGIILLAIFVMISRQQQQTSRTIEVIHPINDYSNYIDPGRRYVQALPPRRMLRRVKSLDD